MSEAENIERVVNVLLKVPEKKLLIIELVNSIPIVDGELDYNTLVDKKLQINLATAEAATYGSHTIQAVSALLQMKPRRES